MASIAALCWLVMLATAPVWPGATADGPSAIEPRGWLIKVASKEAAHHHTRRALLATDEHGPAVMRAWFSDWKVFHNKTYASQEHERAAFAAFETNMRLVHDVNTNPDLTYWASGNQFSDLTWEQFKSQYLSSHTAAANSSAAPSAAGSSSNTSSASKRSSRRLLQTTVFDWRSKGVVTPVRNQGSCGACYAFAAMHAIEAAYQVSQGMSRGVQFSIQEILDCFGLGGCKAGGAAEVFNTMTKQALALETNYPLTSDATGVPGACRNDIVSNALSELEAVEFPDNTAGYDRLEGQSEDTLIAAMQVTPCVHHYEADIQFMTYAGGIYSAGSCTGNNLNHAITSWGFNRNEDSWTFKNSWGPNWGDNGYVRIKMVGGTGTCGLYKWVVRPSTTFSPRLSGAATAAAANIVEAALNAIKSTGR